MSQLEVCRRSSRDKQVSSFVTCLPRSRAAVSSPARAGPVNTGIDTHPYPLYHSVHRSLYRGSTNSVRTQHIPRPTHFLDKSTRNAPLELQRLGYRLPPEKLSGTLTDNDVPTSWVIIFFFTTKELRKIILEDGCWKQRTALCNY